jgi:hypothetical protein
LDPTERATGTVNMRIQSPDVVFSGEVDCDGDDGWDFRATIVQGDASETIDEYEGDFTYATNNCGTEDSPDGNSVVIRLGPADEIVTQYDGGSWDNLRPGDAKWVIEQGVFHWTGDEIYNTWERDVSISSVGLPVAENVVVRSVSPTVVDKSTIDVSITATNPANHGVTLEGDLIGRIGGTETVLASISPSFPGVASIQLEPNRHTETVTGIPVPTDTYDTIEVCFDGVCGETDAPIGDKPPFDPTNVVVSDCSVGQGTVTPGGFVPLSATIENQNFRGTAAVTAVWSAVGSETSRSVTVPPRESAQLTGIVIANSQPGEYTVSLDIDVSEAA